VPLPSGQASDVTPDSVFREILHPDKEGQLSYTGVAFSPDGARIYLANVDGNVKVFGVKDTGKVVGLFSIPLPLAKARGAVPRSGRVGRLTGMASASTWRSIFPIGWRSWMPPAVACCGSGNVGFALSRVALAGQRPYVSNWGGRRPEGECVTGPAGHGTLVRVDPVRYIANEGSVSVIDLSQSMLTNSAFRIRTPNFSRVCAPAR